MIAETYAYGGRDGRVSQRDTQMTLNGSAGESFTQTFTWYHLGMPQQIGYPQCTHTGCALVYGAARRSLFLPCFLFVQLSTPPKTCSGSSPLRGGPRYMSCPL